jgi:hypothetical protein
MDDRTENLSGSKSRDCFKLLHKRPPMPRTCWACDVDLELVEKEPVPHIVGRIEFKCLGDGPTFTECIAYAEYMDKLAPVYVVYAQHSCQTFIELAETNRESEHRFNVYRLDSTDYRPATWELSILESNLTWKRYAEWELALRSESRRSKGAKP